MNIDMILKYRELWDALAGAHANACLRANLSSQVITAISHAGGEPLRAVAAGMLTLETLHAPVALARQQYLRPFYPGLVEAGGPKAWGYGSSFVKGIPDPMLGGCRSAMKGLHGTPEGKELFSQTLPAVVLAWSTKSNSEVLLYPNLAHYTAILAELIQWPAGLEFVLVAALRAPSWAGHLKP